MQTQFFNKLVEHYKNDDLTLPLLFRSQDLYLALRFVDTLYRQINGESPEKSCDYYAFKDSKTKVATARKIVELDTTSPYKFKKKFIVIERAEGLTTEAANCLLKTLEEPGKNTLIILIAVNSESLLDTIVSRCLSFEVPISGTYFRLRDSGFSDDDIRRAITYGYLQRSREDIQDLATVEARCVDLVNSVTVVSPYKFLEEFNDFHFSNLLRFLISNGTYKQHELAKRYLGRMERIKVNKDIMIISFMRDMRAI